MEKTQRVTQIYGYVVCLVAVVTFLICVASLVNAVIDLGDPLHAGWTPQGSPSLASYDNYKMDILKSAPKDGDGVRAGLIPDEQTLRAMYESAKEDKIQSTRHQSNRTIIVDGLLVVICVGLFVTHWRWMRRLSRAEG